MHPCDVTESEAPTDALVDPFLYLPAPVDFTDEMEVVAERYTSHNIDWNYYPAFQAAAFLRPKSAQEHEERRQQFLELKESVETKGFNVPETLTRLYMTDAYIDRLHHNGVWPSLPEEIVRLPANPEFAAFLFLIEGQGCGIWHLLLAPDGSHTVVTADACFGCPRDYPSGRMPDPAQIQVFQCMDTLNCLLYHYFISSARHDEHYLERLEEFFSETGTQ